MSNSYLQTMHPIQIRRDLIIGTRTVENYLWSSILFVGGTKFINVTPSSISGFEITVTQQLVMGLYGYIAISIAIYLMCSILWDVGGGYNEYNKDQGVLTVVRWGFPGKTRRVQLEIPFSTIQALSIQAPNSYFSKNGVNLQYQNGKSLPLLHSNQTLTLYELEKYATQVALFIEVPLT